MMLVFPTNGEIEHTQWEKIARQCLPGGDYPDINRIGTDFIEYLHFNGVSVHHPSVHNRFLYFCKHLAARNHD